MERVVIQLEPHQLDGLDAAARRRGISRAALIREIVEQSLAEDRRRAELDAVVLAYRADPPDDLTVPRRTRRAAWPASDAAR